MTNNVPLPPSLPGDPLPGLLSQNVARSSSGITPFTIASLPPPTVPPWITPLLLPPGYPSGVPLYGPPIFRVVPISGPLLLQPIFPVIPTSNLPPFFAASNASFLPYNVSTHSNFNAPTGFPLGGAGLNFTHPSQSSTFFQPFNDNIGGSNNYNGFGRNDFVGGAGAAANEGHLSGVVIEEIASESEESNDETLDSSDFVTGLGESDCVSSGDNCNDDSSRRGGGRWRRKEGTGVGDEQASGWETTKQLAKLSKLSGRLLMGNTGTISGEKVADDDRQGLTAKLPAKFVGSRFCGMENDFVGQICDELKNGDGINGDDVDDDIESSQCGVAGADDIQLETNSSFRRDNMPYDVDGFVGCCSPTVDSFGEWPVKKKDAGCSDGGVIMDGTIDDTWRRKLKANELSQEKFDANSFVGCETDFVAQETRGVVSDIKSGSREDSSLSGSPSSPWTGDQRSTAISPQLNSIDLRVILSENVGGNGLETAKANVNQLLQQLDCDRLLMSLGLRRSPFWDPHLTPEQRIFQIILTEASAALDLLLESSDSSSMVMEFYQMCPELVERNLSVWTNK